jgi:hypothetical protein
VIGFIISVALAIAIPAKMSDPDDWAYYYTTQNFAGGHLTVDTQTHQQPGSVVLPLNGFLIDSILREKESRKS